MYVQVQKLSEYMCTFLCTCASVYVHVHTHVPCIYMYIHCLLSLSVYPGLLDVCGDHSEREMEGEGSSLGHL